MESLNLSRTTRLEENIKEKTVKRSKGFFSDETTINKKLHKIYLSLALFLGTLLAIGMPFFNEPDGAYHYVNSSNMVGLTTDISAYGETSKWYGYQFEHEKANYENGTFFEKYFETQVQLMPLKSMPRSNRIPSVKSYNYWGHLIPAVGVWLGYHIYPSLGVMITVARLFNVLILSIGMFFIIKFVKRGKLLFALVGLSPVMLNTFASLSYDGLSFLLAALAIALAINTVVAEKVKIVNVIGMVISALLLYFAAKTNLVLLVILFPIVIAALIKNAVLERTWHRLSTSLKVVLGIVALILVGVAGVFLSRPYGGIKHVVYKLFINLFYNFNPNINVQDINTLLVQPLATHNMMPFWLTGVWLVLLVLAVLAEKKYVKFSIVSWGALGIFLLNVLAIYVAYFTGFASGRNGALGAIGGVQGRYITPTLLLLSLFAGNSRFKLKVLSYKTVTLASIFFIVLSNGLLLFDTLFTILRF